MSRLPGRGGARSPRRAIAPDYDSDPDRFAAHRAEWIRGGDVHGPVAERFVEEGLHPVVDVGAGTGVLGAALPAGWPVVAFDASPTQLDHVDPGRPRVRGDARRLPFSSGSVGAVALLWVLYHLDDPVEVLAEASRVLAPGGLLAASTASRRSDRELTGPDGYPPSSFDAEEAEQIVREVFDDVTVLTWDGPYVELPDRAALEAFCRSHHLPLPPGAGPTTLTKRGCLVYARRTEPRRARISSSSSVEVPTLRRA